MIAALFFQAAISAINISYPDQEDIIDAILDEFHNSSFLKPFSRDPKFISLLRDKVYESPEQFFPFIDNYTTDSELQHAHRQVSNILISHILHPFKNQRHQRLRPAVEPTQSPANWSIPSWVLDLIKAALKKLIDYILSNYEITIQWDSAYKGEYQAVIISLVQKSSASNSVQTFYNDVKAAALKYITSIPIKFDFTTYGGNPSVIIYWSK